MIAEADQEEGRQEVRQLPSSPVRHRFARAAFLIAAITILSRLLGLVREALIAGFFGVGPQTDAFFVAFRVPDIIFNSLMNFFVATCFVPIFTETLALEGDERGSSLATSVLSLMSTTLIVVSLLMMLLAEPIIHFLAPGLPPATFALTVRLMRIMAPIIVFGGLTGLGKSILNTFQRYLVPAFVPVVYNVVMIVFIIALGRNLGVEAMAWGLLVSALFQCSLLLPNFRSIPLRWQLWQNPFRPVAANWHKNRRIAKLALPVLLALLLGNFNAFIETYLASNLAQGAISYLQYAYRIFTVPEQIFTIVVSTIVFPLFAADVAAKNWPSLREKAKRALSFTAFAVLPASILLVCLSPEVVGLMLGRGAFSASSVNSTSGALASFTLGLFPVCARSLVTFIFFALQETRFLLKLTAFMLPLQIGVDVLLIPFFSFKALALGNSIAATVQLVLLVIAFRRRIGGLPLAAMGLRLGKVLAACTAMFLVFQGFRYSFIHWQVLPRSPLELTLLLAWLTAGAGTYFAASWCLRIQETTILWQFIAEKAGRIRHSRVLR